MEPRRIPVRSKILRSLIGACAIALPCAHASGQIQWRSGALEVPLGEAGDRAGAIETLARFADRAAEADGPRRLVVSFDSAPTLGERQALTRAGVELLSFVGDNSFFASVDPTGFDSLALDGVALRGAIDIDPRWKMHPDIDLGIVRPWTVVEGADELKHDGSIAPGAGVQPEQATVAVVVFFHPDVSLADGALEALGRAGATSMSSITSINAMVASISASRLEALASQDEVQFIEPPLPALTELNADIRANYGVDTVQASPYGLDGTGVDVLVFDSGLADSLHPDFAGRIFTNPAESTISGHSTHVAGTVGGSGAASTGVHAGMAPGADIISYGFVPANGFIPGFLYSDPGDLEADYLDAITMFGADIANNSIGSNVAPNGFPCSWEGDYGATSALIDAIVRGSLGAPFRTIFSAGNERQGFAQCGATYRTTAPPANAKNHITVGALNSNDDSVTSFTSWGPADDGRLKPDIVLGGCQSNGDFGVTSASYTAQTGALYDIRCGTSMSAPAVTGIGALLSQDYRAQFPMLPEMRNSTLKILLAHSARDLVTPGPDYQTGFGAAQADAAVDLLRSGAWAEETVSQGEVFSAISLVGAGAPELKVTVAWDDFPGTPNVTTALVNDLDVFLVSPSGTTHFAWTLGGTADPSAPAARDKLNKVDNIEQVVVDNPEPGAWLISVIGTSVPTVSQVFSIASSEPLEGCSDRGIVSLDRSLYPCETSAALTVIDCGLNTDPNQVDIVFVNVDSDSDPTGVPVLLLETAPDDGVFVGSVALSQAPSGGELLVADGDTITATYDDADDGAGMPLQLTAQATLDCQSPIISNVVITDVAPTSATVLFETDEPALVQIESGIVCLLPDETHPGVGTTTSHVIEITGLQDSTEYFFTIDASDPASNTSTDDNSGQCYSFTTSDRNEYFTELFYLNNDNDLDFKSLEYLPTSGPDRYILCARDVLDLPHDPMLGTPVNLGDDINSFEVVLADGKQVLLYGQAYPSFWINPNGHITFLASDRDRTPSPADHFGVPRISALYDDLDPATDGEVSWVQLSDRVVVTFLDVPEFAAVTTNTFQYELFFNGKIRITYLDIAVADGLTGISEGLGVPADFAESDLTAFTLCPPAPPATASTIVTTPIAASLPISLPVFDDGFPESPGALTATITALPLLGVLLDAQGQPIQTIPHQLSLGELDLAYAPTGLASGIDRFSFIASDGGSAPEGGDSDEGLVTVIIGQREEVATFMVDDSNPGFSQTDGIWGFGQPIGGGGFLTPGGRGQPDPFSGFTGDNVFGYNLAGNYVSNLLTPEYITTPTLDFTGFQLVELEFQQWLGVERRPFDGATVEVRAGNQDWQVIWQNPIFDLGGGSWERVVFDISGLADLQPDVQIRWGMGPTDSFDQFCGWNIDDVRVRAIVPVAPCPGDANFDRAVDFGDITMILGNWGNQGATRSNGDANDDAQVDFADVTEVLAEWGSVCP